MQLDVIYRRAVTKDVMENLELVKDFIDAIKADDVSIIGAFQTQLIHHKMHQSSFVRSFDAEVFHSRRSGIYRKTFTKDL